MTDYVQEVITYLDTNWDTNNYDPQPVIVDARDGTRNDTGDRVTDLDLGTLGADLIEVDKVDERAEPEGLGYSYDAVEATVAVEVQAVHESEWGQITGPSDWVSLWQEARRALRVERKRPVADIYRLEVRVNDEASGQFGDYYRQQLDAVFVGIEQLP